LVDARSRGRFEGSEPEPRPGLRGGHVPGSRNLPYTELVDADGLVRPPAELRTRFATAGVDLARPIIASCGSGVSACAIALALDRLGCTDVAIYDGSWTEWAARSDTAVATGTPEVGP
jgi:thiosulfate/3-mercaptopyruvate sulfurtransferase